MANILLRTEKLDIQGATPGGVTLLLRWKGRGLRLKAGDRVVFVEGKQWSLRFESIAEVIVVGEAMRDPDAQTSPDEIERPAMMRKILISSPKELPNYATLANFAYSLQLISNVLSPWRHIRHGVRMLDHDLNTLEHGEVHGSRTVYFGLLSSFPIRWARTLDAIVRARQLAVRVDAIANGADEWSDAEPSVTTLRNVVERLIVTPTRLAIEVGRSHARLFPDEASPEVIDPDRPDEQPWQLDRFVRLNMQFVDEFSEEFSKLLEASAHIPPRFSEVKWRPYHF